MPAALCNCWSRRPQQTGEKYRCLSDLERVWGILYYKNNKKKKKGPPKPYIKAYSSLLSSGFGPPGIEARAVYAAFRAVFGLAGKDLGTSQTGCT